MPLPIIPIIALGGLIFRTAQVLSSKPSQSKQYYSPAQADRAEANRFSQVKNRTQTLTVPANKPAPNFSRPVFTTSPVPSPPASPPKSTTSNNSGNKSNTGGTSPGGSSTGSQQGNSQQGATPNSSSPGSSSGSSPSSPSPSSPPPVKSAPIDTVIFSDEAFAEEFLTDVLFEDVVGLELLTLARNDTVNGQDVIYQPIKNLGLLQGIYNPSSILGLSQTSASIFASFSIKLNEKIPSTNTSENGKNYYVDEATGDIIVELVNILNDEQVEVQIAVSGTIDRLGI
jgi:hypothetical protein